MTGDECQPLAMNLRGREDGAQPELDTLASLRAAEGGSSRSYVVLPSPASLAASGDSTTDSPAPGGSTPSSASPTLGGGGCCGSGSPKSPSTTTYEAWGFNANFSNQGAMGERELAGPLTLQPFSAAVASTCSAGGSPASRSASPANEEARETTATSGPNFSESSPYFGHLGSSSKTCRDSEPTSPKTSRTTDVYAAGLIDGEGCLYVDRALMPCLDVGMAESAMPLLAKLQATYGGSLKKFRPATEEWQAGWTWRISGTPCAETLRLLLPHLRLKHRQAELLLALQELKDSTMLPGGSRARWTPETRERAERIRAEVKTLNRRGPDAGWDWPEGATAVLVGDRLLTPQLSLLNETGYDESSGTFPTSGLAWATGSLTGLWTVVSSECRSDAAGCSSSEPSLTQILEPPQSVPAKYSLSARAARGILRRAEKRGKNLPEHLRAALAALTTESAA